MVHMSCKINIDSLEPINTFLQENLTALKAEKKEISKTTLMMEEILITLSQDFPDEEMTIQLRKRLGDVTLRVIFAGMPYDIKEILTDKIEDTQSEQYYRLMILRSNLELLSCVNKNNKNVVIISVRRGEKKQVYYTLGGMVLGILFGFILKNVLSTDVMSGLTSNLMSPIKTMFLNSLKMMIAPVVFFSIASCIGSVGSLSDLGRMGGKVFGMYILTTIFAIGISFGISALVFQGDLPQLSTGAGYSGDVATFSIKDVIVGIIPGDLITPILKGDMLQIIFVAIIVGIAASMLGERAKLINDLLDAGNQLSLKIISILIKFVPIAAFCAMFSLVATTGLETLLTLFRLLGGVLIGAVLMILIYGLVILIVGRRSPLPFFKKILGFLPTPFSLVSSNATMPLTMNFCDNKMGVSPKLSSFSIPIGATVNMDGSCIFLMLSVLMFAKMYGIDVDSNFIITACVSTFVLSVGAPGITGSGLICLASLSVAVGVPIECVGIIMGVDQLFAMIRTASNVAGDIAVTVATAGSEGILNDEIYKG